MRKLTMPVVRWLLHATGYMDSGAPNEAVSGHCKDAQGQQRCPRSAEPWRCEWRSSVATDIGRICHMTNLLASPVPKVGRQHTTWPVNRAEARHDLPVALYSSHRCICADIYTEASLLFATLSLPRTKTKLIPKLHLLVQMRLSIISMLLVLLWQNI